MPKHKKNPMRFAGIGENKNKKERKMKWLTLQKTIEKRRY